MYFCEDVITFLFLKLFLRELVHVDVVKQVTVYVSWFFNSTNGLGIVCHLVTTDYAAILAILYIVVEYYT